MHYRRNELREVKLLQREEQKETQDLMRKVKQERETQEKTFDQEKQVGRLSGHSVVVVLRCFVHPRICDGNVRQTRRI